MDYVPAIMRWLHFMAGVMWIGLLYYFNFVQVAALKAAAADSTAAGITKHVAPRALFYFRWSALVTWLAGAALLGPLFVAAFTLQPGHVPIGIGAWLGLTDGVVALVAVAVTGAVAGLVRMSWGISPLSTRRRAISPAFRIPRSARGRSISSSPACSQLDFP